MPPKSPIERAGISIVTVVEVAFKVLAQDAVDVLSKLLAALQAEPKAREAWSALSAGKQRGLAYMVASAKRAETRQARVEKVNTVLLGEGAPPWVRE
jgi:uncharacterized protein YdeI (YjbR/CyaY-like superfamily)